MIQVWRTSDPAERTTPAHSHAEAQLFSLDSGLAIIETSKGTWMLPPGRCGWIPAEHRHALRSCGRISGWSIYLPLPFCEATPREPAIISRSALLQQMVLRLMDWSTGPTPPNDVQSRLLTVLCDEIHAAETAPLYLPLPADPRLLGMVERLSAGPAARHTAAELARTVAMSERSFLRRFQQETGLSFGRWQQQFRVLTALEQLFRGKSVTETSFDVGFESVSAFIRLFKRVIGETPAVYCRSRSQT